MLIDRVRAVRAVGRGRLAGAHARRDLRTLLAALVDEPRFARTYLLEINAAGARAQAARDEALRRFAQRYGSSFLAATQERPGLRVPSDDLLFILAAGTDQLICAKLRADPQADLLALEDVHRRHRRGAPRGRLPLPRHDRRTLMDLTFSDQEPAFRDELRAVAGRQPARRRSPTRSDAAQYTWRRDWQRQLYDGGWAARRWPAEYGGRGATLTESAIFFEELGRARAPLPANVARPAAGRPDADGLGHRRAEGPLPPADPLRRGDLVPGLLRARRRLRPRRR